MHFKLEVIEVNECCYYRQKDRWDCEPSTSNQTFCTRAEDSVSRKSDSTNIIDQPSLARMLNPSVFFNSVRDSKKRKGPLPMHGKGCDTHLTTPLITLHQVTLSFSCLVVCSILNRSVPLMLYHVAGFYVNISKFIVIEFHIFDDCICFQ